MRLGRYPLGSPSRIQFTIDSVRHDTDESRDAAPRRGKPRESQRLNPVVKIEQPAWTEEQVVAREHRHHDHEKPGARAAEQSGNCDGGSKCKEGKPAPHTLEGQLY